MVKRPVRRMLIVWGVVLLAGAAMAQNAAPKPDERCRVTADGRLVCDAPDRPKLDPAQAVRDFFSAAESFGSVRPARLFAGPDQYPPLEYRGYGILVFPSLASEYDIKRQEMICAAYVTSLPPSREVTAPTSDQFVTIWPIVSVAKAREISVLPVEEVCPAAIANYSQKTALSAIEAAARAGFRADGLGPYLLAWSPPEEIGASDTFVLALDLSNVRNYEQALAMMREWNSDVETDFGILADGFTLARLRILVRRWADNYGDGFLQVLSGG